MKRVVMEICADYHVHLVHFPNDSPKDFASSKICRAAGLLEDGRCSVDAFLFLCRSYAYFLKNYRQPTAEEQSRFDFDAVPDSKMRCAMVCIYRTPSDDEGVQV